MPYSAEQIWQDISGNNFKNKGKSVHLEEWPKCNSKKIDEALLKKMSLVKEIISVGLKERDEKKISLKWPLQLVSITYYKHILDEEYYEIIKQQLNVKEVEVLYGSNEQISIEFDTKMTPELEAEGYARELSRLIQAFRKELGLEKKDKVKIQIVSGKEMVQILEGQKEFIKERTNAEELAIVTTAKEKFKKKVSFDIKGKRGEILVEH
jgi:isoleucyl-tRNA synthetase